ncbi:MAG: hypothetical protein PHI32_03520 [Dysgonamonadaceae bacterium]|nr:hypothetical protein [Dysgonamonadaceae bacterium]MDD4728547.1 hypothetical protein [Dysgonamonadaceae bacterium]
MLQTIIISIVILAIAIMLMGVKVFFTKKGTFPNTHVSSSQAMKDRGITCASSQEKQVRDHISPVMEMLKSENL